MKLIRHKNWIKGKDYQKRILLDELPGRVNLIQDVIVKPNSVIPSHKHDFTDEIFYITENSGVAVINGEEFEIFPGDVICINRNEEHGFKNLSDKELKIFVLKMNFKEGDSYLK